LIVSLIRGIIVTCTIDAVCVFKHTAAGQCNIYY